MTNETAAELGKLDLDVVRANIPGYSTQKLCEMIVCDRYFGCYHEMAIMCMEELAKRRAAGDNYDFEQYIQECLEKLPKFEIKLPNLRDVMAKFATRKR